ncbi:MAG: asparaginase [Anaerolineales bacterium]|nr:asparaginase [Anaerolineales bacterium]
MAAGYLPVLEVTRGEVVESIHYGAVAVVSAAGDLVASYGDPGSVTYLRSSAKPFQALPLIESGALKHFGLSSEQLAVICASHSGTDEHVAAVASIHTQVGLSEADLQCGTHPPDDPATRRRMQETHQVPTPIRHMCSGKHSGMLAVSRHLGAPLASYLEPDHPAQRRILEALAEMSGLPAARIAIGTDGCSAPTFALPLQAAAQAFARLADAAGLGEVRRAASQEVFSAMVTYPAMVHGAGEFDTRLMQVGRGEILCKRGAEGYCGLSLRPGALGRGSPSLGVAIKIADGDLGRRTDVPPGNRAVSRVVLQTLHDLGALTPAQEEELAEFGAQPVINKRRLEVGWMRPCFSLDRGS